MPNPTCPHCGTAIEEHEAGRCLDAWVAETVMGWKWLPTPDPERRGEYHCWVEDGCEIGDFEPSADMAAAWEVVERMNSRGFWSDASRDPTGYVCCAFDSGKRVFISPKKTKDMPLAICRAAILATSATKENT